MAQKVTHWLLISLILSLGFGQLLRLEYLGVPIYLHDILVVLILLSWFLQGQALQVRQFNLRGLALLGAGLTLGWISALLHYPFTQLLVPFLYTLRLLAYLALYLVLKKSKLLIPSFYFLLAGLTTLLIGLVQYIALPDMRVFQYLGWDDHLNRLTLPHFDPTFTSVMLGLFLLSLSPKLWYFSVLTFISILLTYSRSVWLSLIFTGLMFIKNKKILLISGVLVLMSLFALPQKFGEGNNLLRTYSISSRLSTDVNIIKNTGWNLVIGQGMNTFPRNSINNSYLYLLATTGVIGLTGWVMFMISLYQKSLHKPMLIFFFIASLFNNVMFYPFALLWVLLTEFMAPSAT